jgi:hypothetical protein
VRELVAQVGDEGEAADGAALVARVHRAVGRLVEGPPLDVGGHVLAQEARELVALGRDDDAERVGGEAQVERLAEEVEDARDVALAEAGEVLGAREGDVRAQDDVVGAQDVAVVGGLLQRVGLGDGGVAVAGPEEPAGVGVGVLALDPQEPVDLHPALGRGVAPGERDLARAGLPAARRVGRPRRRPMRAGRDGERRGACEGGPGSDGRTHERRTLSA